MFEELARFRIILVTGPQRSGTTLCARAIAHDTGHTYVDEEEFAVHDRKLFGELARGKSLVIQCPAMARWIHEYAEGADTAVVWMLRPVREIVASQERIGWEDVKERAKYAENGLSSAAHIATIKNRFWQKQKELCVRPFEVHYHDLQTHPLWVAPRKRKSFGPRQWE